MLIVQLSSSKEFEGTEQDMNSINNVTFVDKNKVILSTMLRPTLIWKSTLLMRRMWSFNLFCLFWVMIERLTRLRKI